MLCFCLQFVRKYLMRAGVGLIVIGLEFSPRKDKFINFHESVISKQLWKKKTRAELIAAMRHVAVAESFAN